MIRVYSNGSQFRKEFDIVVRSGLIEKELKRRKLEIGEEALRRLVGRTPVKTGLARGNWQVTIGAPATDVLDRLDTDGAATIAAGLAVLRSMGPFDTAYFTNNVPYFKYLDQGSSTQAPNGITDLTFGELTQLFPGTEIRVAA